MATTTLSPRAPAADQQRLAKARTALTEAVRRGLGMVSAARHRYRRPALTITGLTLIDAALFQHGWFAGLLATGISVLVFEWLGADDEPGGDA